MSNIIIQFKGFNPHIKQLRSDGGYRIEFDVDETQYNSIKELPPFHSKLLDIKVIVDDGSEIKSE